MGTSVKKKIKITSLNSSAIGAFEIKLSQLKEFVFNDPYLKEELDAAVRRNVFKKITVFLSVCDKKSRAAVFNGSDYELLDAWNTAVENTRAYIAENNYKTVWLKADITIDWEVIKYEQFKEIISQTREFFYKKGISFDTDFQTALLSEQLNTMGFINYKRKFLSLPKIREYFEEKGVDIFKVIPDNIIVFSCSGYFCDENKKTYKLYFDEENYGRRVVNKLDKPFLNNIIMKSSHFLSEMVKDDGQFKYGINSCNNFFFTSYNILRHTGTIWSILMQYQTTNDEALIPKIDSTIKYMLHEIEYMNDDTAFLVERKSNEIKIGGNAVAIITLSTYMEVFQTDEYNELVKKLGNGILMMQEHNGSFYHVLNYPDFSKKERERIVYYDGEAAFALSKVYGVTKNEVFLNAAEKAVDYFIKNSYEKYRDHWIAYSINEITKYKPEDKYFSFGLKNADLNLDRIYNQDTSYHTYMELLMSTFCLYERIIENNISVSYMKQFDVKKFILTIYKRAHHMLNGYLFPEIAMYMESPETVAETFCVRHDSFRIRIDDVQHFIGGYFLFLENFDKLEKYFQEFFSEYTVGQE